MELSLFQVTYLGGGGHELLTLIPHFLELRKKEFGSDIQEIQVQIFFKYEYKQGMNQKQWSAFNESLPQQPTFRIIKTAKKLKIKYVSKYAPPYYDGLGRAELMPDKNDACVLFEQYLCEFCETLEKNAQVLRKRSTFNSFDLIATIKDQLNKTLNNDAEVIAMIADNLVATIKQKLKKLPATDAEIIAMIADEKIARATNPPREILVEPYRGKHLPSVIPVARYQGGSYYIGRWEGGKQFWGQVVASFSKKHSSNNSETAPAGDWQSRKRWYAILHTFDSSGNHLGTEHAMIGTTADGESKVLDEATAKMESFIAKLGNVRYENIAIKLFQVIIDGDIFGMVDSSSEEYGDSTTMEPGGLYFHAPWNGEYDT